MVPLTDPVFWFVAVWLLIVIPVMSFVDRSSEAVPGEGPFPAPPLVELDSSIPWSWPGSVMPWLWAFCVCVCCPTARFSVFVSAVPTVAAEVPLATRPTA